jgi:hypothetical protein
MRFTLWTLVESRRKVISVSDCYLFMSHITHLLIIQLAIAMAVRGVGLGSHSSTNLGSTSVGNCAVVARAELGPLGRWPADCFPCDILWLPSLAYAIRRDHRQFWISRWKSVALGKEAICSRIAG